MTESITVSQLRDRLATRTKQGNRRKPVMRESQLQQSAVKWFRYAYPQYKDLLFSIPNGGHRNKVTAARMKAEGQLPGVPDLMLAVARYECHGMFIEMKHGKGELSWLQAVMIGRLFKQGYRIEVINSLEKFQEIINSYLHEPNKSSHVSSSF